MHLGRLLAVGLLCLPAFSQTQPGHVIADRPLKTHLNFVSPRVWSSLDAPTPHVEGTEVLLRGVSEYRLPMKRATPEPAFPVGRYPAVLRQPIEWADNTVCYTIDSYVVARDGKDSDAVHPVGSSTCIRGSQIHLKSADVTVESVKPE